MILAQKPVLRGHGHKQHIGHLGEHKMIETGKLHNLSAPQFPSLKLMLFQHSGRLRQEDHELKACLGYRGGLLAGSYLDSLFVHYGGKLFWQAHG